MIQQKWFVYIVQCADGTLYTGATPDIDKRIAAHNAGTGAKYTSRRLPVQLLFSEACVDRSAALKREHALKKFTRAEKFALITTATSRNV
jgi:predicted GIY-YIG superfamily endonuclease